MDETLPFSRSPREPRSSVILRALVESVGAAAECRVRNLSAAGACVDNPGGLVPGRRVLVTMGTLHRIHGEVVWITERLAGLRFDGAVIDIESARRPRGTLSAAPTPIGAGWLAEADDPYRRPHRKRSPFLPG